MPLLLSVSATLIKNSEIQKRLPQMRIIVNLALPSQAQGCSRSTFEEMRTQGTLDESRFLEPDLCAGIWEERISLPNSGESRRSRMRGPVALVATEALHLL